MFVDEAVITVAAGHGGEGCVSFRREKYVPKGGPDGGNGGKGGDVLIRANSQIHTLLDHRYRRHYKAEDGAPGSTSRKAGKWGKDIVIQVPRGTVVKDAVTDEIIVDLCEDGQEYVLAKGGKGGRGNAEFATPTLQTPRFAESGLPGEERTLALELKLIADIGLVGLPNAGKSTLISVISAAHPKIADYPFTTLEPNLGIVHYREFKSFTVADLPGLIEGAHEGRGLGIQFLRHIERTNALAILIDCMSDDYNHDFSILRTELESYSKDLAEKPHIVAISKLDSANDDIIEQIEKFEKQNSCRVLRFSSVSGFGIKQLLDAFWELISETKN